MNDSSLAVDKKKALTLCRVYQKDVQTPCTLVGEDGVVVESGVARLASLPANTRVVQEDRQPRQRQAQPPTRALAFGSPPAGGDALYAWCRHAVFTKYGRRGSEALAMGNGLRPGQKAIVMLESTSEPMIAYCMQQGGKSY
jgi:hypothetical protein